MFNLIPIQNGMPDMARECLKMYFMKPPPANQFLCRAYLCQAQLLAPKEANNPVRIILTPLLLIYLIMEKNNRFFYCFSLYSHSSLWNNILISLTTGATRKGSSLPCKSHIICQKELKVNKNILTLKS